MRSPQCGLIMRTGMVLIVPSVIVPGIVFAVEYERAPVPRLPPRDSAANINLYTCRGQVFLNLRCQRS